MAYEHLTSRLDDLPLSRHHWRVILGGAGVFFVVVPNTAILAFVLARLFREWSLSPVQIGLVNSLAVAGMLGGSLGGGYAAGRFGRRPAILCSLAAACAFSALSALAWNLSSFIALRMLTGAGAASAFACVPILFAEVSPRRSRGRIMIFTEVAWALGASLAALDGYLVIPSLGWRIAVAFGCLPLLALPVFSWAIVESPRFLAGRGKVDEAEAIVRAFESSSGGARPSATPRAESPVRPMLPPAPAAWRRIWAPRFRRRTVVLWAIWFAVNSTYYGVFPWLPSLMVARGIGEVSSFGWNVYVLAMLAPGAVVGGFLSDYWGRKRTLIAALIGNGVATFFFGLTANPLTFLVWGGLFAVSNQAIWVSALAYTNEMYPSDLRAQGLGYAAAVGRVGSILAPYAIGSVLTGLGVDLGYTVSFGMFAVVLFAAGATVLGLGTETKGRSLEELTA